MNTLNLTERSTTILNSLATACSGKGQIGNSIIAHALQGQWSNSSILTRDHCKTMITKIVDAINAYFEIEDGDNGEAAIAIFDSIKYDETYEEFKINSSKDLIIL